MSDAAPQQPPPRSPRRSLATLIILVATGAAMTFYIWNRAEPTAAAECPVQAAAAAAIDAVAVGNLAALNGTGQGRGYADLAFTDSSGQAMTIADFAGRKLLVNFWASWCGPCRAEMPELEEIAAKYNSDDFLVLPISLDIGENGLGKARDFLAEGGWPNLPLYADTSFRAFERLKQQGVALGLPATLLLDEEGCELAVLPGPAAWDSTDGHNVVEALLGV